jgi:SlyX protein
MTSTVDQSIENIETKIAYLEHAVGELSDVVFRQQREMQALKAQIEQLRDRLEAAQTQQSPADPALERPPHY